MAITPRTIFTNPASAALTAASLFAITATGMYAFNVCGSSCSSQTTEATVYKSVEGPCEDLRQQKAFDKASWSEFDWYQYANCFDTAGDTHKVVEVTTAGIKHYPTSEALYNLKGYHLINLDRHEEAVETLEKGLRSVGHTTDGTMTNNLAWAGLWVPREMSLERSRALYKRSLSKERNVCETIHTGLWVEYAVAKQSQGIERAQALHAFNRLADAYEPCHDRLDDGNREKLLEVLGAAVIIRDIEKELDGRTARVKTKKYGCQSEGEHLMSKVATELRHRYQGASIDALCREAAPVPSAHHTCVDFVDNAVTLERRRHRARTF